MTNIKHGLTGFQYNRCRCDICCKAAVDSTKKYTSLAKERFKEDPSSLESHSLYGYQIGCRCEVCVEAQRDFYRKNYAEHSQHFKETGVFKSPKTRHGTLTAYRCGCRCELCKQVKSDQRSRLNNVNRDGAINV